MILPYRTGACFSHSSAAHSWRCWQLLAAVTISSTLRHSCVCARRADAQNMQTVDAGPTTTSQYHEPPYPPSPAESGFPSPASEGLSARALFKLDTTSSLSDPMASAPTDTIPQTPVTASLITDTPTPTPPHETLPDIQMPAIIAAAIPLTTPPIAKATRSNLRLPPFDLLGIAVSRPDRISMGNQQATPFIGAGPPSQPEDPLHLCKSPFGNETRPSLTGTSPYPSKLPSSSTSPQILCQVPPSHKSIQQYILTQTPPDDNGKIDWSAMQTTQAAPLASPEQGGTSISHPSSSAVPSSSNDDSSTRPTSVGTPSFPGSLRAAGPRNSPWLRDVVPLICTFHHDWLFLISADITSSKQCGRRRGLLRTCDGHVACTSPPFRSRPRFPEYHQLHT